MTIDELPGLWSTSIADTDWRAQANCRTIGPSIFFPAGDTPTAAEDIKAAKAMCESCLVREACLAFAVETRQSEGIWGGATEEERRRAHRAEMAARRLRAS